MKIISTESVNINFKSIPVLGTFLWLILQPSKKKKSVFNYWMSYKAEAMRLCYFLNVVSFSSASENAEFGYSNTHTSLIPVGMKLADT